MDLYYDRMFPHATSLSCGRFVSLQYMDGMHTRDAQILVCAAFLASLKLHVSANNLDGR